MTVKANEHVKTYARHLRATNLEGMQKAQEARYRLDEQANPLYIEPGRTYVHPGNRRGGEKLNKYTAQHIKDGYDMERVEHDLPQIKRGKIKTPHDEVFKVATVNELEALAWYISESLKLEGKTGYSNYDPERAIRGNGRIDKIIEVQDEFSFVQKSLSRENLEYIKYLFDTYKGASEFTMQQIGYRITNSTDTRVQRGGRLGTYRAIATQIEKARIRFRLMRRQGRIIEAA